MAFVRRKGIRSIWCTTCAAAESASIAPADGRPRANYGAVVKQVREENPFVEPELAGIARALPVILDSPIRIRRRSEVGGSFARLESRSCGPCFRRYSEFLNPPAVRVS